MRERNGRAQDGNKAETTTHACDFMKSTAAPPIAVTIQV